MEYRNPKIVYAGFTHELPSCMPEYDWDESDFILHTSIVTGVRTIVHKGTYFKATIRIPNFLYTNYNTYKAWRGQTVTFYPYGTEAQVQGGISYTPPSLTALVTKVRYYHMNSAIYTDACLIELISQGYKEFTITAGGSGS